MQKKDQNDLRVAVNLLEDPSVSIRLINLIRYPIEGVIRVLPGSIGRAIGNAASRAVGAAFYAALSTIGQEEPQQALSIDPSGDGSLSAAVSEVFLLGELGDRIKQ